MGTARTTGARLVANDPAFDLPDSAAVLGAMSVGTGVRLAHGAVARARGGAVRLDAGAALLENGVVVGTPAHPVVVGAQTFFGHRCLVVGATLGRECEVGNASVLMPGARLGDRCFLAEGTVVPAGAVFGDAQVLAGRPARVVRGVTDEDLAQLARLRPGGPALAAAAPKTFSGAMPAGAKMGKLYAFRGRAPAVAPTAVLFDSAEVTGDVIIGDGAIIGAGVKIIGDAHGPVRIGARVQILENTVLHLLPDNALVLEDDVVIGPGAMIHGCHLGAGTVVEPGAIVCDGVEVGRGCLVAAGSVVKQRSRFGDGRVIAGHPATDAGPLDRPPALPDWALRAEDLATLCRLT